MAEWSIVLFLITVGLALVVVEVFLIPGTSFVGLVGFLCMTFGVVLSFYYFNSEVGWLTLAGATSGSGLCFYFAFRTNAWRRFTLTTSIDGRTNEIDAKKFPVGMVGVAKSALRPIGNGEFGVDTIEVKTLGEYVDAGTPIRIIRLSSNQVIVEKIR